ncbi:AraC family transcriptional regulator [Niveibacterium sp. SC-1]|uniref:helix-turn-helix transcriptional regulator n=1 Tax=Niveibacterium sp. SC-1 TaxID=3135646 RepID=UPI00311F7E3B
MAAEEGLRLPIAHTIEAANGGLFISRGVGTHPRRVIDSFELIFVREGVLSLHEEGREFEVAQDEALILWPGREHGGTLPYPPDLQFYWVHFRLPGGRRKPGDTLLVPQHTRIARPEQMSGLFRRLLNEQEHYGVQAIPAGLMIALLLWEVTISHEVGPQLEGSAPILASRADTLIRTHFHEPISASSVATQLRCNPDYLGRVFRRIYRCTLTEAIHARRLRHAKLLLAEGRLGVDQVARQCGFDDASYFRRVFKRAEGMTPQAYRRLHVRVHVNTS